MAEETMRESKLSQKNILNEERDIQARRLSDYLTKKPEVDDLWKDATRLFELDSEGHAQFKDNLELEDIKSFSSKIKGSFSDIFSGASVNIPDDPNKRAQLALDLYLKAKDIAQDQNENNNENDPKDNHGDSQSEDQEKEEFNSGGILNDILLVIKKTEDVDNDERRAAFDRLEEDEIYVNKYLKRDLNLNTREGREELGKRRMRLRLAVESFRNRGISIYQERILRTIGFVDNDFEGITISMADQGSGTKEENTPENVRGGNSVVESVSDLDKDFQTIIDEIPQKYQIDELKDLLKKYKNLDQKKKIYQKIDELESNSIENGDEFGNGVFNKLEIKEDDRKNIAWIRKYLNDAVLENPNTSAPEILKKAEAMMRDTRGLYQIVIGENLRELLTNEIYARSDLARLVRWWDELKGNMQSGTEPYDLVKNRMERVPVVSDLTKKWLAKQTDYSTLDENNEPITINLRDEVQKASMNIYALMAYDVNEEAKRLIGPGKKRLNLWSFSDNPNRKAEISRKSISGNIDSGLLAWQLAEAGCWQAEFDSLHPMRRLVRFSEFRLERMYKISAAAIPGGVRLIYEKGMSGLVPKIQNYRNKDEYDVALSKFIEKNRNVFEEEGTQFAKTELDYFNGRLRKALLEGRYLEEWSNELDRDDSKMANLYKTMLTNFQSASVVVDTLATIGGRSKPGDVGAGVLGKLKSSLFVNGVNMGYSGLELGRHVSTTLEEWTKSLLFGNSAANPYVLEENTWPMDQLFRAFLDSVRWDNSSNSGLYIGTGLPKRESVKHNTEFVEWFNDLWLDCSNRIGVNTSINLNRFITRVIGMQLDERSTPYSLSMKYKKDNLKWRSLFSVEEWRNGAKRRSLYEVAW